MRTMSESIKLVHKTKADHFKMSQEAKEKMRESRLNYLKTHRESTAWRRANMSYPEAQFIKYLESRKFDQKYLIEREYSVFPYYIDFAFVDIKLAIEIDGSQHLLPERKEADNKKDTLLKELGWKVVRISENTVKTNWDMIDNVLSEVINSDIQFTRVGIIRAPKKRQKVQRDESGLSEKQKKYHIEQRKVKQRPDKDTLLNLIKTLPFTQIGKMYNVTDNTIRKWCKAVGLPYTKQEIKKLLE